MTPDKKMQLHEINKAIDILKNAEIRLYPICHDTRKFHILLSKIRVTIDHAEFIKTNIK